MTDSADKKAAGIGEDAPFVTLCPGCGGDTYCYTMTHGKCIECHGLYHYDTLEKANETFKKARQIIQDMFTNRPPLTDICYKHSPILKLISKEKAESD